MSKTPFLTSARLAGLDSASHGFFTRQGGVSANQFASLNCSEYCGDDVRCIRENRSRVAQSLGAHTLFSLKQIHSARAVIVDGETVAGKLIKADAMATREPGVALGILGADCAAVLLADEKNRVVGAAHGGWQGALSGVTGNVIDAMCALGAEPSRIVAAVGPAIQPQSYQVGNAFVEKFLRKSCVCCAGCFRPGKNAQEMFFDLPAYLVRRLHHNGIRPGNIERFSEDTYADEQRYFSYRRSRQRGAAHHGRQVAAICIK